jgi:hypothetical protein
MTWHDRPDARWPGGDVGFVPGGNVAAPAHPHRALTNGLLLYQAAPGPAQHRLMYCLVGSPRRIGRCRPMEDRALDPSYLLKTAHTASADVGRPGAAGVTRLLPPAPQRRYRRHRHVHRPRERLLLAHAFAFADAKMEKGQVRASGGSWCRLAAGAPWTSRMRSSSSCAGSFEARAVPADGRQQLDL